MTEYKPRSAWTSSARGGAQLTGAKLEGIVWHWPGTSRDVIGVESEAQVANRLRGYRNFHVGTRGWADIGYGHAVDQAGRVWDLRGLGRVGAHCASAANPDANHEWHGVLLILGREEAPSAAMIEACRDFRAAVFLERWPGRTEDTGHGREPGVPGAQTSCPGPYAAAEIRDGTFTRAGGAVSLYDEFKPQSDFEKRLIPDGWADEGYRYLIKAAAALAWLRSQLYDEVWYGDRIAAPDSYPHTDSNPNWQPRRFLQETVESLLYHVQPDVARTRELVEAMADSQLGADVDEIRAHIDQRYDEAAQQRQELADRLDEAHTERQQLAARLAAAKQRDEAMLDLLQRHADGNLDETAVVEGIRDLLHQATAPDADADA